MVFLQLWNLLIQWMVMWNIKIINLESNHDINCCEMLPRKIFHVTKFPKELLPHFVADSIEFIQWTIFYIECFVNGPHLWNNILSKFYTA